MADKNDYNILSDEEVDSVVGGALTGRNRPAVQIPHCRLCGFKVIKNGSTRIEGGNTGVYECTNPACDNYGKTLYNTGVRFEDK